MAVFAEFPPKEARRPTDAPGSRVARISWLLVTLLCEGVVDCASCIARFEISRREFQRDLHDLREIGKSAGFAITKTRGGRVFLQNSDRRLEKLGTRTRDVAATLARIALALGGPIERELLAAIGDAPAGHSSGFLHVREAVPSDDSRIVGAFAFVKDAAAANARVEFAYTSARSARSTRRVEPYHVVARSGRYYLVGYDMTRRDWRQFALDAITGPMRREGTFAPRPVPERFLREGAVGWIRGGEPMSVTIRVSAVVAAAVTARKWQPAQRVNSLPDGGAEIVLQFEDIGEAVRWSLQFGADAVIVAPPQAVALARRTVDAIAAGYESLRADGRRRAVG